MTDDERAVRMILQETVDAWAANDADAYAARYAKDATVTLATGEYLRGRDEIRAFMAAGFAGRLAGTRAADEPESVRLLGADAAVVISRSGFLLPGETELPPARLRRATWVLTRDGAGWAVAAYGNCAVAG